MTIQQVVEDLQKEKQAGISSRFPCRAIMVTNVEQYCQLLSELNKISDIRQIRSEELFTNPDVMPKYENLMRNSLQNEWIILTGVSEYLRLFSRKEAKDRRFLSLWRYQAPASSTGRIIIPLWGCEAQWFDHALDLTGDLRQQDFFYDCRDEHDVETEMDLLVLSGTFEEYLSKLESIKGKLHIGLQEWFEYWENPSPNISNFVLLTKKCKSISTTSGKISVRVIDNILAFIRENMPGASVLTAENCSPEMQSILLEDALKGTELQKAILRILNVSTFVGTDVMGKWNTLSAGHKDLVRLWISLHPDGSYLSHCFEADQDNTNIPYTVEHEIFNVRSNAVWVTEYIALAKAMSLVPDQKFFEQVSQIPEYEVRLDFVANTTRAERIYLLKMVGQWFRKDPAQVRSSKKLQEVYPELSAYLRQDVGDLKDNIGTYMSSYKAYKLANTLPSDEDTYFNGIQTSGFESRYSILSEYIDEDTVMLWIDALGIEWLSLLCAGITRNCDCTIKKVEVTQATLPTETCYNNQWESMSVPHQKLDKLDKLAHKGVIDEPDYYSCIEEQLAFVTNIHSHITELLKTHHRVIVTGDHGTSRLAARFFHARNGIAAPVDAEVGGHGRFCKVKPGAVLELPNTVSKNCADGSKYIVFANYDHFKRSGFAAGGDDDNAIYGEVHGGASPEEMLVPVVVVDGNHEVPLKASWKDNTVKIFMRKAKFTLNFNKTITNLIVKINGEAGQTAKTENDTAWNVVFPNIKAGTYHVEVYADSHIVSIDDVTIKPALGGGDGDLP